MHSLPLEEALTNVPAKTVEQTPWYSRFGKRRGLDRSEEASNQVDVADTYERIDVSFLPFDSYLIVFVLGEYMLIIDIDDYSLWIHNTLILIRFIFIKVLLDQV